MSVWENQRHFTTVLNFLLFHVVVITCTCVVSCHVIFPGLSLSLTVFAPCFYHLHPVFTCVMLQATLHCCLMVSYALSGLIYMHARVIHLMENYNKKKINLCVLSMPFLGFFFFYCNKRTRLYKKIGWRVVASGVQILKLGNKRLIWMNYYLLQRKRKKLGIPLLLFYSEIRCIELCVLQTWMGFWIFQFPQSF